MTYGLFFKAKSFKENCIEQTLIMTWQRMLSWAARAQQHVFRSNNDKGEGSATKVRNESYRHWKKWFDTQTFH